MPKAHVQPKYASLIDATRFSGLSEQTLRRLIKSGDITAFRPSGKTTICLEELDAVIQRTAGLKSTRGLHLPPGGRGRNTTTKAKSA